MNLTKQRYQEQYTTKKIWAGFPLFNVSYQHCCKKNININDSQNLAFATSHFVIELLPFDYLRNQKQRVDKKMHFKRNNSSHSCRTFSTVGIIFFLPKL
jgi:hypothetical protein